MDFVWTVADPAGYAGCSYAYDQDAGSEADRGERGHLHRSPRGYVPRRRLYFHLRFVDAFGNSATRPGTSWWVSTQARHPQVMTRTSSRHRSFTVHLGGMDTVSGVKYVAYSVDGAVEQTLPADRAAVVLRTWKRGELRRAHRRLPCHRPGGNETNGS